MSLVETDKLILLITDLDELLSSWNVAASDAYAHTLKLKAENIEVHNLAEKDKSRAIDTEESDRKAIEKSTQESQELLEKSEELHKLTEPLPKQAQQRVKHGQEACKISQQDAQKAGDWLRVASKDLQRAQSEYDKALRDYNEQVTRYNNAVGILNRTPQYITVTVSDGNGKSHTETRRNPAWDRAKAEVDRQKAELDRRKRILDEKERNLRLAHEQYKYAENASNLSQKMLKNSQQLLEKALDLQEWSNNAYRSASYALSAAKSALNFDREADKQNGIQHETNDETLRLFEKIKTALDEIVNAVQKIVELTDSCNGLNVQFSTSLEGKTILLHKISAILPDEIRSFIVE